MRDLQPVSIGGIELDALMNVQESYNADVPSYPVDTGFAVSDNVALDALELQMTLIITATPVTWLSSHGSGENRLTSIPNQLTRLYETREPIAVITRSKSYSNMVIKTMSISKSEDSGLSKEVSITFTQVTVTSSAEVEIPAKLAKSGTTQANAGSAGTSTVASGSSGDSGSSGGSIVDQAKDIVSSVTGGGSGGSNSSIMWEMFN